MKKIILVDSGNRKRGFFSSINLTLLTILWCKKNNINPVIGKSVLALYSDNLGIFSKKRPVDIFFPDAYSDDNMEKNKVDKIEISWVHNNQEIILEDESTISALRDINAELLLSISQDLKRYISEPPAIGVDNFDFSVHYRGCDYLKNTPGDHTPNLNPVDFYKKISPYILKKNNIYVATDDNSFISLLKDNGISINYFNNVTRKGPGRGVHIKSFLDYLNLSSKIQVSKGFEVFRDCYWLSKGSVYIGSNSNLMYYSKILNKNQKQINLSVR